MARRLVRFDDGDEIEIVGYQRFGEWVFRNPRSGAWQWSDANVPDPRLADGPQRHRGPRGGPTDEDLGRGGLFNIRYHVNGRDYYQIEYHPAGVLGRAGYLRSTFEPPPPQKPEKSPRRTRPGEDEDLAA
jgi:hypothetical protein